MDPLGINTPDLSVRLLVNELVPNRYAQRVHRLVCCNSPRSASPSCDRACLGSSPSPPLEERAGERRPSLFIFVYCRDITATLAERSKFDILEPAVSSVVLQ